MMKANRGLGRCAVLPILCVLFWDPCIAQEKTKQPRKLADFDAGITEENRRHWAYQPIKAQPIPKVKHTRWVRNPIDGFILAKLEKKDWQPTAPAKPRALLRRVYLDVIGLPPTLEEQSSFLNDQSPDRWERLIQNLLSRPAYGERWGRHWLDLVRYAESNGYERDAAKPFVWRYRDYVIRAFNQDKPFDRFILEQIAGDELPDADSETVIATGFHRLGPWDDEPADPKEDRFDQLNDIVSTTSLVFMGLTMGCARCHDHKFDALTMHDYYRMVAIFNPLQRPRNGRRELSLPAGSRDQVQRFNERNQLIGKLRQEAVIRAALQRTGNGFTTTQAIIHTSTLATPDLPRGYFMNELSSNVPATHILLRGKAVRPGPKVDPGFPAVMVKEQPKFLPPGKHTTRRRLTFAKWIASSKNPLTARVIVNRVWQFHFGRAIVRSPSDFGVKGQRPTHPELLDWLANWFVENGWSFKKLHTLILTSNTYRMSKAFSKQYGKFDPENTFFWRFPYRRLEVEAIRDSVLSASGQLNRKMFGPSMYPEVPKESLKGSSDPNKIWKEFDEHEASRRTVYAFIKRSFIVPFLEVLDFCDTAQSTEKRLTTTVAPQSLTLFNGAFVNRQAKHLAERLVTEAGHDETRQIERAYRLVLCRPPTNQETAILQKFLQRERTQLLADAQKKKQRLSNAEARHRALAQMCRVMFNLNEFVYPD